MEARTVKSRHNGSQGFTCNPEETRNSLSVGPTVFFACLSALRFIEANQMQQFHKCRRVEQTWYENDILPAFMYFIQYSCGIKAQLLWRAEKQLEGFTVSN